jgi:hypothetical protein
MGVASAKSNSKMIRCMTFARSRPLRAQRPADTTITVVPAFGPDRYDSAQPPLELAFSRALGGTEGRLAIFVGTFDGDPGERQHEGNSRRCSAEIDVSQLVTLRSRCDEGPEVR